MNRLSDAYERVSSWWMQHSLFDPAWIFVMEAAFEEGYAIRAGLMRLELLQSRRGASHKSHNGDGETPATATGLTDALVRHDVHSSNPSEEESCRLEEAAFAFCDRVVSHQGVQGPAEALFMGYGMRVKDGIVDCSCVADQSSVASAVLDTLAMFPQHPRASEWLACIERWAAWVIREFATPSGGIGVGILGHQWNPMPEYWCATSLFATSLFKLARVTEKDNYGALGMKSLDWLARFDFKNVSIPTFIECAPEVILYASEGIVEGLRFIASTEGTDAARAHPAADKFREMARWLVENLDPSTGLWPEPVARGYRDYSLGIAWILTQMNEILDADASTWIDCARRSLTPMLTAEGQKYYGAYVRPWSMSLVWLSLGEWARTQETQQLATSDTRPGQE